VSLEVVLTECPSPGTLIKRKMCLVRDMSSSLHGDPIHPSALRFTGGICLNPGGDWALFLASSLPSLL
jgi:hypothetical protein